MCTTTHHTETTPATFWQLLTAIFAMSLPVVISNVSRTAMGFVDFGMVSTLGTAAQAALTPAMLLLYCVLGLGIGTMGAVNTFVSQSVGRGRPQDAATYAWQAAILGVAFGVLTTVLIPLVPAITALFGHAPDVWRLEIEYLQWGLLSAGPSAVAFALTHFFVGIHRPWLGCAATIAANLFNAMANYVLIFGHWGFPAMGIAGAAIATLLATTFQCLVLFGMFWSRPFRHAFSTHHAMHLERTKLAGILRVGLPIGAHFSSDIASWTAFVAIVVGRRFGTEQLAATNIIFQYMHVAFMPAVGIGMAVSAMIGKAIGRRDYDLAVRQARSATVICMTYMGLCGLLFLTARHGLISAFTNDPAVIEIGTTLFVFAAVFQLFDGLGISSMNALRGAGDTYWPSVYVAVLSWSIQIAGGLLLGWFWPAGGARGPWMMSTVYIIVVGLVLWRRFRRGAWRRVDIFRETPTAVEAAVAPMESAATPAPTVAQPTIEPSAPPAPVGVALED